MLRTGAGFAIAFIVDAECEKTLIGGFSRSSDDVFRCCAPSSPGLMSPTLISGIVSEKRQSKGYR